MLANRSRKILQLACVLFVFCRATSASELILLHGHIYTGNPKAPWAEAIAITAGKIDAVGTDSEMAAHKEAQTKVIDLRGKTVIPGITDSHMHLFFGGMALHGINLSTPESSITADALAEKIKSFAANHPTEKILFGRADFGTTPPGSPSHSLLDKAVSDRPLIIHNTSEHALWLNAKALEFVGIGDSPTTNPLEERYVIRDASGHPSGVLLEDAMEIVERAVMAALTREEKLGFVRDAAHYLNRFGITSVVNATGNLADMELYAAARDRGDLTVRTRTSFGSVAVAHRFRPEFFEQLEKARTLYHDDWVSANLVKFFADGGTGMTPPLVYDPAGYKKLVMELDKRGFQVMTHALRSDSAHLVLDTYEAVAKANGPRDRRFRMEHGDIITDDDLPLPGKNGVLMSMQPAFCCSEIGANFDPNDKTPTDRWQSLAKSGATVAFGSDWPCTWPPDPFVGMQQAVTRTVWKSAASAAIVGGVFDGAGQGGAVETQLAYVPEERLSLEQALAAYTRGGAYLNFAETKTGTLEAGKFADLAVLSQNPFAVSATEISKTHVVLTIVGGKIVFNEMGQ
ncbi:MAG: amidohydrolase [Candidatus Acidiferrum sp.]